MSELEKEPNKLNLFNKRKKLNKVKERTYSEVNDKCKIETNEHSIHFPSVWYEADKETLLTRVKSFQRRRNVISLRRRNGIHLSSSILPISHKRENGEGYTDKEFLTNDVNRIVKKNLEGYFSSKKQMIEEEIKRDNISGSGELLERIHQLAMEEYIQNQIDNEDTKTTVITENDKDEIKREVNVNDICNNKCIEERLIKKSFAYDNKQFDSKIPMKKQIDMLQDGDMGSGGAMLGGTGIAEVSLPVEERLRSVRETEMVSIQKILGPNNKHSHLRDSTIIKEKQMPEYDSKLKREEFELSQLVPVNFDHGPGKKHKKRKVLMNNRNANGLSDNINILLQMSSKNSICGRVSASSAGLEVLNQDVHNLGNSYAHNYRLHQHEWLVNMKSRQETSNENFWDKGDMTDCNSFSNIHSNPLKIRDSIIEDTTASHSTVKNVTISNIDNISGNKPSDDRIWRSFVLKERSRSQRGGW